MDLMRFVQVFGDDIVADEGLPNDADIVSTLEFDKTGEFLAVGDKGGRVVIFQKLDDWPDPDEDTLRELDERGGDALRRQQMVPISSEYRFFTEFQSHEPEFDYLKSIEIEEKINKIKWLPSTCNSLFVLSTNDKAIKLWKMREKQLKQYTTSPDPDDIFPKSTVYETLLTTTPRKIYTNGHFYHINSISPNSDGESFLSADDLRINLWNVERTTETFNMVDIKPDNLDDISEVVTCAEFHPSHCSLFMHTSSKGSVKLSDMRMNALCDNHVKYFCEEEDPNDRSFFSEVLSSITDAKFSPDARYILTKDFLSLKIWDINMESHPVRTIKINEFLRPRYCEMYENDLVFDKFECGFSGDGSWVCSGSYDNNFYAWEREGTGEIMLKASRAPLMRRRGKKNDWKRKEEEPTADNVDCNKKILHLAFHPRQKLMAIGALNNLYIYAAPEYRSV